MRLVTYKTSDAEPRPGVLVAEGQHVLDIAAALDALGAPAGLPRAPKDMIELLAAGPEGIAAVRELVDRADLASGTASSFLAPVETVHLLAPVPRPPRLRDYLTYSGHASNADFHLPKAFYELPIAYDGNANSIIGPGDEISWPAYSDQLDYELEIALVIGKAGRDLSVEEAAAHIAGITLLNDVSARDIQLYEMTVQLGPNKGKHFCNVLGPTIATLDGLDEYNLSATAHINGELWSQGSSKDRQYSFAEVVAWASWGEDLQPGEIIGLGTVSGGCGLELGRWIQPGDLVELELEHVGKLQNRVGPKQSRADAGIPSYRGSPRYPAASADKP